MARIDRIYGDRLTCLERTYGLADSQGVFRCSIEVFATRPGADI